MTEMTELKAKQKFNMSKSAKELKKIEIQRKKLQLEQERSLKPGECNRFLTVVICRDLMKADCFVGKQIVEKLNESEFKVKIESSGPNTVTWKRQINKKIITDERKVIEFDSIVQEEPYLLVILNADTFILAAKENNKLLSIVQDAQDNLPFDVRSTTLVVYGLKDFCRKRKNIIGIKETEIKLTQLQLLANCSHRLHETPDDVALTVAQMSKAIAEEPFKTKQSEKLDREQLFITSDVKVDANEDAQSLGNLWQTQLICLPKVTFEVAQSIRKEYPMPRMLMEAYKQTTNPQAMLSDIQIIRTGPLAKQRKIGPELSRKIYTLMTSKNANDLL
jgi:crossover junction endonuclease EME1